MTASHEASRERPDYGMDAPGIMIGFLVAGVTGVALGATLAAVLGGGWAWLGTAIVVGGLVPLAFGAMMVVYWLVGKTRTRDHMLSLIAWRGDERVLDVGTGAGFMMIGAARHASRGRVTGIDAWSAKDLSNNAEATTRRNIALEQVEAQCELLTGDARELPFPDASFDVVVSLLCLHNIEPKPDQARACREIARVLKPGGRIVIGDYVPTHDYAKSLADAGLTIVRSTPAFGTALSLMWILVADKTR